jgi:hypothetical protein
MSKKYSKGKIYTIKKSTVGACVGCIVKCLSTGEITPPC